MFTFGAGTDPLEPSPGPALRGGLIIPFFVLLSEFADCGRDGTLKKQKINRNIMV